MLFETDVPGLSKLIKQPLRNKHLKEHQKVGQEATEKRKSPKA